MEMKKVMISSLFLVLLVSVLSFASALTMSATPVNDVIIKEFAQPAKFTVTLSGVEEGDYQFYTLNDFSLSPKGFFHLGPGTTAINVDVYPTENLDAKGYYSFTYNIKKYDGASFEDQMTIKLVNLVNTLEIGSDTIDPNSTVVSFYVQNKENAQLTNVKAKFSSVFFKDSEQTFNLAPLGKAVISIPVSLDDMKKIKAGVYVITGEFQTATGTKTLEGKLYLGEKKGIRTEETTSGFLVYNDMLTKTNTGNVPQEVTIQISKDVITRLFTSFNVVPNSVERHGLFVKYTWVQTIGPTEALSVNTKTNYVFPVFIILFAALIIFAFNRYAKTKIDVVKSVSTVRAKGGEFALRVSIRVKARRNVENVSIIDRFPSLVSLYESFGVVKPSKVDVPNRRLHWEIGGMQAGEERIVSYIVFSKIGVVGKFSLPPALSVFEKDGTIHEVESNSVFFLAEQVRRSD